MATMINDTRTMLQRSRSVADNADFLSMALVSGDQGQIENAVDDLLAAYDSYTGQAKNYSSRLGFDEMAQLADPVERDQSAANALADALIDLEVAMVLGRVAQATGEIEGQVSAADLDEAVATLNETIKAIEGPSGAAPGMNRFAFDEVIGSERPETVSSLDVGCRNHGSYTCYSFPGFWSLIGMKKSMPLLTQRSGYILFFPFLKIAMRRVG